jgi:hypothetical protein
MVGMLMSVSMSHLHVQAPDEAMQDQRQQITLSASVIAGRPVEVRLPVA